jgi:NAD(P)-dependent dehydrogenase (short-subunit alcohol dehydrogenase family)
LDSLDYLVNNAGVYSMKRRTTPQGLELDFAINYLGHFYLTYLLWPLLNKATAFRIINLASVTHKKKYLTLWG